MYAYEEYAADVGKTIAFRPLTMAEDLVRLHGWMHQPHVIPFWNLALPLDDFRRHLERALADRHQRLYIGLLDGVPMSYWEAYWAKDDIIGRYYAADPADQGIHLLIGPPRFLGKGYALLLLRAMTSLQFRHPATRKIVAEPDIRNAKMIHIFSRCGFEPHKEVELPDKRGLLMVCDRDRFMRSVR